jgi:hypothetical protein
MSEQAPIMWAGDLPLYTKVQVDSYMAEFQAALDMVKLRERKEAARAALLAAYVAGDQAAIDAAMATLREWCTARGFKERRKGRGK